MLKLTRRIGESVRIGDEITVKVIEIKGTQVRIGIKAPKEITVHREEVADRIAREQHQGQRRQIGRPQCAIHWHIPFGRSA